MQVKDRIKKLSNEMTATERKLCTALLLDYPFAGLVTINTFAENTQTSPPTVSRFVAKLGFQGFQDFQRHLIDELKEGNRSPVDLHQQDRQLRGEFLEDFVTRAVAILSEAASATTAAQFERICALLSDEKRSVSIIGGRISDSIAIYLSRHLRQIRDNVFHLQPDPESWPQYLLQMKPRDVLFISDFRRYQANLQRLAQQAAEARGAQVIVLTDKWLSPAAKYATEVIATPIESGTVWDSYCGALVMMEAIVTRIAESNWDKTRRRIEAWDMMRMDQIERPNGPGVR